MLTVLRPAENIGSRTAWWCRCDCGTELPVKTEYLRNGHATHCGCQYREKEPDQSKKQSCRIDERIRTQNFTGQRFGALTVLGPAEKVNGYLAWNCRCDCGREIVVQAVHLCRGNVLNCGCGLGRPDDAEKKVRPPAYQYRDTRKQDMTGRRFGALTVISPAENINGHTAWNCRCDCGAELVVRSEYLRRGKTKSCGCQAKSKSHLRLDLTGQRFGKLTVLRLADKLGDQTAWWCQCDCGREIVAATDVLRGGKTQSCGCDAPPKLDENYGFPSSLHLVDGTCVEVLRSKTLRRNNTSGVTGVFWDADTQRWKASICFKGQRHRLGSYIHFEDAVKARKLGEEKYHDAFLEEYDRENSEQPGMTTCADALAATGTDLS